MRSRGRLAAARQSSVQVEMRVEMLQARRGGDHCRREEQRLFKGHCHGATMRLHPPRASLLVGWRESLKDATVIPVCVRYATEEGSPQVLVFFSSHGPTTRRGRCEGIKPKPGILIF